MKRIIALCLALLMCLSLVACGGSGNNNQIVGNWVSLYSSGKLTFNKDKTLLMGENVGTWSKDDTGLSINYTVQSNGSTVEMYCDVIEENGITLLRNRKSGKSNGEAANFTINEYYPENKIEEIKASVAKVVGDTVSTDIMEITVNNVGLSYYSEGASTSTSTGKTTNAEEACSPSETGFFVANKGRTLVCLDFTLTNTDRDSLNTNDYIISFYVKQNDDGATVRGYDLNNADGSYGLNLSRMPIATNNQDFYTNDTSNVIIRAGDSIRVKYVGVIGFDADLLAPFELVVDAKNSSNNNEKFIYTIGN